MIGAELYDPMPVQKVTVAGASTGNLNAATGRLTTGKRKTITLWAELSNASANTVVSVVLGQPNPDPTLTTIIPGPRKSVTLTASATLKSDGTLFSTNSATVDTAGFDCFVLYAESISAGTGVVSCTVA